MKGAILLLTAWLLAGCSGALSDLSARQVSHEVQLQINALPQKYRQIAADTLPGVLKGISLGGAWISELSRSTGSQSGDWTACIKTNASGRTEYFAIFYMDGKYLDVRRAVMTDNCEVGVYGPLPIKPPVGKRTEKH